MVRRPIVIEANLPDDIGDASRWRTRLAQARPDWRPRIGRLASAPLDRTVASGLLHDQRPDGWRDEAHLRVGLRHARALLLAALIDRDLAGAADLAEVMQLTTAFAELAIGEALTFHSHALADVHGVPIGRTSGVPQDLIVVGMGKLGGGELNVSSDIDLIFVHPEAGETSAHASLVREDAGPPLRPIDNAEFFARLGRKLIATLADVTADGFVFRVDMRLRPDGDSGPLVTSFAMLETYLVRSARDWERFAWIKGRVVSRPVFGTVDAERELMQLVVPFVYRRYLDFGAIDALRTLHGQIAAEAARREAARRGRAGSGGSAGAEARTSTRIDVKLGRGGIREIEFIAQHFQLIRGGRDPALRLRPTVATLDQLVVEGLLDRETGLSLREAYAFLRNVEHRLQYLDDAQTHTLPARDQVDDCARLGVMCERLVGTANRSGFDGLVDALERRRAFVAAQFDAVFAADEIDANATVVIDTATTATLWAGIARATPQVGDAADAAFTTAALERLEAIGFVPPDAALARIVALARGSRLRSISTASRARLDTLVPQVIDASGRQAEPTATLGRWFDLIETIAGRSAYFALLDEFPAALAAVTRLLAASPWAAHYLTRHPLLLDDLIATPQNDGGVRDAAAWTVHWHETARALERQLAVVASDGERQMDVLREVHHAETFRLLIEDLEGHLPIEMLSDQLSTLADLTLDAAITHCWSQFVASRPDDRSLPRRPAFAVIAYGKLGGKELGYLSDLDLVFLFEPRAGAHDDPDGDAATVVQQYVRFAQRLNLWLTARTPAGALFDIDLRLRPDGAAGLVVSSFEAWSRYERRASDGLRDVGAWTWEHQALTRARFCAGDRALGALFEGERLMILAARDPDEPGRAALRREIVSMRRRMHDGHPNRSAAFDLKHDDGGMVDIEFAVQYLVLAYGAAHRPLLDNVGNIALLSRAADAGLIDANDAREAADAYRTYRARQHAVRLADPLAHAARVDATLYSLERASVRRLWQQLFVDAS